MTFAYLIPTEDLADLVRPLMKALDRTLEPDEGLSNPHPNGNGVVELLSERLGLRFNIQTDSVSRKLFEITRVRTYGTRTEMADALLLELGVQIEATDLPILAGSLVGAADMVNVWADENEPGMSPPEREQLAQHLQRFSAGYLKASAPEDTVTYIKAQSKKSVARTRRYREAA